MNIKLILNEVKKIRLLGERQSKKNYKQILKPFNIFAKSIEKEIIKSNNIKELVSKNIDKVFVSEMKKSLNIINKSNITDFVDFFDKDERRNIKSVKISAIKNDLYNKNLKNKVAGKVNGISSTFKKTLNSEITKMAESGLSANAMAKKIVELSKGSIGKNRALLISREETSQVLALTNHTTAVESKMNMKTWVHAGGGITDRINHLAVDNVTLGIDETFNIGNYKGLYPKDDNLPAGEVINCYCVIFYDYDNTRVKKKKLKDDTKEKEAKEILEKYADGYASKLLEKNDVFKYDDMHSMKVGVKALKDDIKNIKNVKFRGIIDKTIDQAYEEWKVKRKKFGYKMVGNRTYAPIFVKLMKENFDEFIVKVPKKPIIPVVPKKPIKPKKIATPKTVKVPKKTGSPKTVFYEVDTSKFYFENAAIEKRVIKNMKKSRKEFNILLQEHSEKVKFKTTRTKSAHYDSNYGTLNMKPRSKQSVYFHETAHFLDDRIGKKYGYRGGFSTQKIDNVKEKHIKQLIEQYTKERGNIFSIKDKKYVVLEKEKIKKITKSIDDEIKKYVDRASGLNFKHVEEEVGDIYDLISGMTHGYANTGGLGIKYGHSVSYWRAHGYRGGLMEGFANINGMLNSEYSDLGEKLLKDNFPDLLKAFNTFMEVESNGI